MIRSMQLPFIAAILVTNSTAAALPVTIQWQAAGTTPANTSSRPSGGSDVNQLTLEVASDKGFGTIVHSGKASPEGRQTIEVPREGVYHWRLVRPPKPGEAEAAERSSHISGSLAAFDTRDAAGTVTARLTWQAAPGADRYKLTMSAAGTKLRELTTNDLSYFVAREAQPLTIEVAPWTAHRRATRLFHYDPSLEVFLMLPPAPPVDSPVVSATPLPEPAPGEVVAPSQETTPLPATAGEEAKSPAEPQPAPTPEPAIELVPGERRLHHVTLGIGAVKETLRAQKLDADLRGTAAATAIAAGFWTNPAGGIVVDVRGDYHEFKDQVRDQNAETDDETSTLKRSRWALAIAGGFDFLRLSDAVKRHQLSLEGVGLFAQIPLIPTEVASTMPSSEYPYKSTRVIFGGAGATWTWFLPRGALTIFGRSLVNASRENNVTTAAMRWYGSTAEFYVSAETSLFVGYERRLTTVTRCAGDAGICLAQGKSKTTADENSITVGIGSVKF